MSAGVLRAGRAASPAWLPALLPLLAALVLYRDTAAGMVEIWARSHTFMHAFLVPPIVAWLIWERRAALVALAPRPVAWMLLPMAGVAGVWLLGELAAVNVVTQAALVALAVLAVPAVLGLAVARVLLFPLGFLFFAVPAGEFLLPSMMEWTADFTVAALRLSGIPVYREGLQFVIPSGSWSVVEACSGIRYLIASLMTGVLFAYLHYRSLRRRLIFAAISIVVPMVANWVRAYLIVLLGHLSSNEIAAGADHLIYGWVFFGVVILLMFTIGMRWTEPEPAPAPPAAGMRGAEPPLRGSGAAWTAAAAAAGLLLLPHGLLWGIERMERGGAAPRLATLDVAGGSWRPAAAPAADWMPVLHQPSAESHLGYEGERGRVDLHVGYYHRQDRERKLAGSENRLVRSDDARWRQVSTGRRRLEIDGRVLEVRTAQLRGSPLPGQGDAPRLAVWQLYWVNGTLTASDAWAKATGAFQRLLGRGDDGALVVVSTLQHPDGREEAVLEAFLRDRLPALDAGLRRVRDERRRAPPGAETL